MNYYTRICLIVLFLIPIQSFAFDRSCFTDYTEVSYTGSLPLFVSTEKRDDLFFVQNNEIIPAKFKPSVKREILNYSLSSSIVNFPLEKAWLLIDDISSTNIEVNPIMAWDGFFLTLDFKKIIEKGTMKPDLDINSAVEFLIEISTDNVKYVQIHWTDISKYSFQFLKFTFPKGKWAQASTILRTLRFDLAQNDVYIVTPKLWILVQVYRGWMCDSWRLSILQSQMYTLSKDISLAQSPKNPISLSFSQVVTSWKDSDGDAIIDMRDNCPNMSNSDQQDRDYDGKWDACSDDDNDGIFGMNDNCPTISNGNQIDLNANNIWDACEFDTDKDLIMDGADNCTYLPNSNQIDDDNDRIWDACDNCNIFNPDQLDLDNDSIWDTCETRDEFNKKNDTDKDGILDFSDNCIKIYNLDQWDQDVDGIGNLCDNCTTIKNTNQKDENKNGKGDMCEDVDSDGIDGWRDNCPMLGNADQKDSNNDAVGDACTDTDNDKIYNAIDNCALVYNFDQKDTDGDNIGNVCDTEDNRLIESNKTIFMVIFGVISILFIGGIIFFIRKIKL